tara:strand:+ start:96735 stop:96911 length:177 start_codon:yes stop_codon:yes gene_type:complete
MEPEASRMRRVSLSDLLGGVAWAMADVDHNAMRKTVKHVAVASLIEFNLLATNPCLPE